MGKSSDVGKSHKIVGWRSLLNVFLLTIPCVVVAFLSYDVMIDGQLSGNLLDYALPVFEDPDIGKSAGDLVRSRGFEFESHEVITQDGYIIEIHRIFNKHFQNGPALVVGTPLFCSSAILLTDFRNNTGAFVFADAGYDVWLLNTRGNTFGQRHVSLDPRKDQKAFFDFTYLDIGEFDVAAQIDYVLAITKQKKVHYVAASQGAALFFVLLAKRPSYNEKVHSMVSYAGFRGMCYTKNPALKFLMNFLGLATDISRFGPIDAVMTQSPINGLCTRVPSICAAIAIKFGLKHEHYLNMSRFAVYGQHMPDGTSLKNLVYYGQTQIENCDGRIREFDYDTGPLTELLMSLGIRESKNMEVYGTKEPPYLDFSRVKIPVKLYYSDGDDFVSRAETLTLAKEMNVPDEHIHRIDDPLFTHVNYVFNKQRNDFVFQAIKFFKETSGAS